MITTKTIQPASSAYDYQLLIGRILEQSLRYRPDTGIVYRNLGRYTYRDLHQRVCKLANLLSGRMAVSSGDIVGIIDYDSHRYLEAYFSVPMIGAVLHTINFRLAPEEIAYTINHAGDKVIFCHKDFLPLLEKIAINDPVRIVVLRDAEEQIESSIMVDGEYEALMSEQKESYDFPDFDENSMATLFFTTGTTGLPKAVCFSHRQLVLHTLALISTLGAMDSIIRIGSDDVYMPMTPMFHSHAWGFPYVATFLGMKQVYPGKYEAGMLLRLKEEEKVTLSHGVSTLLQMICSHPDAATARLDGWKIICGGSALPKGVATKALSMGINVIAGYGMSETCPVISFGYLTGQAMSELDEDQRTEIRLKAGRPIDLSDVRLRNEAGEFVAHDGVSPGELVVRSPWAVSGYYNDMERGRELWQGGYLHTGDIGTIDSSGVITIIDRLKDVIKSGGEWISSAQVESLISTCDGVAEVAVVAMPDEKWVERPLAVIVPKAGESLDEGKITRHLLGFVTSGKIKEIAVPKVYRFVSELPKTSAGKIDKKKLMGFTVK